MIIVSHIIAPVGRKGVDSDGLQGTDNRTAHPGDG